MAAKKKTKAGYELTPAQEIMREEMTTAKGKMSLDDVFNSLVTVGSVFDEEIGAQPEGELPDKVDSELSAYGAFSRTVPTIAYTIIEGYDLVLSLKQWQQVQAMVEDGIREGYNLRSEA